MSEPPYLYLAAQLSPLYGEGEARSIARIVLEDAFGAKKYADFTLEHPEQEGRMEAILSELLTGRPVQYVLGEADFFGLKFKVNEAVLIPRQETEELVAEILSWLKKRDFAAPKVLDIGIGSGCIGITLKVKNTAIDLFGVEKSAAALEIARKNAHDLLQSAPFCFSLGDMSLLEPLPGEQYEVIVSNPPYILRSEANIMPVHVLEHEPEMALFVDHTDPLIFYRYILEFAQKTLVVEGAVFFECNEFNAGEVAALAVALGFAEVQLKKDMSGADRIVVAQR